MNIRRLVISNFRNIVSADLRSLGGVTLIGGDNGAGKTSVLEAIHMLALARSFRVGKPDNLISRDADQAVVRAELQSTEGVPHKLGVQRQRGVSGIQCRFDEGSLDTVSRLAAILPAQVLDTGSTELVTGSPVLRRQLLDWGMFHVKHTGFHAAWQRYRRSLEQRNNLLRRGKISGQCSAAELAVWSKELADSGEVITALRCSESVALISEVDGLLACRLSDVLWHGQAPQPLRFDFQPGWDQQAGSLMQALEAADRSDRSAGFTHPGPHRADLKIRVGGLAPAQVLSRGQLKGLAALLRLAQARQFVKRRSAGVRGVFLVDDLPAELDRKRRSWLAASIAELDMQVFATHIDTDDFAPEDWAVLGEPKMFHVKHGELSAS